MSWGATPANSEAGSSTYSPSKAANTPFGRTPANSECGSYNESVDEKPAPQVAKNEGLDLFSVSEKLRSPAPNVGLTDIDVRNASAFSNTAPEEDTFPTAYPLHHAASTGNVEAVERYIREGVDLNKRTRNQGETALHHAAWNGHEEIIKKLLAAGADSSIPDAWGATAWEHAVENNKKEAAQCLAAPQPASWKRRTTSAGDTKNDSEGIRRRHAGGNASTSQTKAPQDQAVPRDGMQGMAILFAAILVILAMLLPLLSN